MFWKSLRILSRLVGVLSLTTVSLISVPLQASSLEFPPSPNRNGPKSTAGGGTRGGPESQEQICTTGEIPLTALIPAEDDEIITVKANPEFFTYVPRTTAKQAQVSLIDQDTGDEIYRNTFGLPSQPGIISVPLPESVALEVGKSYIWQFEVLCNPDDPAEVEFVQVTITRAKLSEELKKQLEATKEPLKQAELLAKERVWLDTLVVMAQLRDSNQTEWEQLLKSVKLGDLSSVPLTSCCTADPEPTELKPTELKPSELKPTELKPCGR
ncbi:MAG: DUF928 domain-containing protein [Microcoleaceae cyanobacterium]